MIKLRLADKLHNRIKYSLNIVFELQVKEEKVANVGRDVFSFKVKVFLFLFIMFLLLSN